MRRVLALVLTVVLLSLHVCTAEVRAETFHADAVTDILVLGGAITAETAIGFCLSVMGFTAAADYVYENRDNLIAFCEEMENAFVDFCAESVEWAQVTAPKVRNWLEGVATGVIDKADETWLAFKDFLYELANSEDTTDVEAGEASALNVIEVTGVKDYFMKYKDIFNCRSCSVTPVEYLSAVSYDYRIRKPSFNSWQEYMIGVNSEFCIMEFADGGSIIFMVPVNDSWENFSVDAHKDDYIQNLPFATYSYNTGTYPSAVINFSDENNLLSFPWAGEWLLTTSESFSEGIGVSYGEKDLATGMDKIGTTSIPVYKLDVNSADTNVANRQSLFAALACALVNGLTDELDGVSVPTDDGLSEEDTGKIVVDGGVEGIIERDGSLDNVDVVGVDGVDTDKIYVDVGGITIEDISKPFPTDRVKTIDKATDVVLPDNTPIERTPTDTTSVKDYTFAGLEKVFPFCIPWDLYLLYHTLVSDAEAPKVKWTFYYVDTKGMHTKDIEIDLSVFDSVAKVLRTMELLAFMVFLTVKTRDLIRG